MSCTETNYIIGSFLLLGAAAWACASFTPSRFVLKKKHVIRIAVSDGDVDRI